MIRMLRRYEPQRWLFAVLLFVTAPVFAASADNARDARGMHGMVSSAHPEASMVGVDIMKAGGNAIDAAVAVGFSLGVLEPNANGIGGGGFMLIWLAESGRTAYIDFRGKAPTGATADMFALDEEGEV